MRVPRHFTDADGVGPERDEPGVVDGVFTVDSLRELMAVLDTVLHRG